MRLYLNFSSLVFICFLLSAYSVVSANPFESLIMPGEVIEGHKKLESDCTNCHVIFSKSGQDKLCLDCHKEVKKDVNKKRGFHGKNKSVRTSSCYTCHTEHKGRKADIIKLEKEIFNHDKTDFKLRGQHKVIDCTACHKKNKKYREAKTQCKSCHIKESPHKKAKAKKGLFQKCDSCHRANSWSSIKFNHNKNTKYKLLGAHKAALCQSCHINQRYKKTPKRCISCHQPDDIHKGRNGKNCQQCHTTKQWGKISFNHNRDTRFKLRGKHKKTSCKSCHPKSSFSIKKSKKKRKPRKCISCHSYDDKHNGVFGKKCSSCHSDKSWNKTKFDHSKDTEFKLSGQHLKTECDSCHKVSKKKKTLKTDCISCHKEDDIHKRKLGTKCDSCHSTTSWNKRVKFDHDLTNFPLIGLHGVVPCEECHVSAGYNKIKTSCVTCHKNDDIHKGKLGNNCDRCHTPNDWGVWFFDHDKQSKFILEGKHESVHCHSCHNKAITKILRQPRECQDCHASDDTHNGQFGARCNDCHNATDFSDINMR